MIKVSDYSILKENSGLLNILHPEKLVLVDSVPPFTPKKDIILLSDKNLQHNETTKNITQKKSITQKRIDTPIGFIDYLIERFGYKISNNYKDYLLTLDEDSFWKEIKVFFIRRKPTVREDEKRETLFTFFKILFSDFPTIYRVYRQTQINYKVIFSSLLTMMLKTKDIDNLVISPSYKQALMDNKPHLLKFRTAVRNYIVTDQAEIDFLTLLRECSIG